MAKTTTGQDTLGGLAQSLRRNGFKAAVQKGTVKVQLLAQHADPTAAWIEARGFSVRQVPMRDGRIRLVVTK